MDLMQCSVDPTDQHTALFTITPAFSILYMTICHAISSINVVVLQPNAAFF